MLWARQSTFHSMHLFIHSFFYLFFQKSHLIFFSEQKGKEEVNRDMSSSKLNFHFSENICILSISLKEMLAACTILDQQNEGVLHHR